MRSNTTLAALLAIALDIPFGGPHVARADDLKPEVLLLAHFKQRVRQDIARLNNCVCLQTIERSMQPAGGNSSQFVDRIRLEITRVGGTELLAWPGGERFEERDVKSFVRGGLVFGGMFASQVRNVFLGEQSTFHYVGPENLQGHHAARFDFSIPPLAGSYKIGSGDKSAWVGSKGSFWFDTESLDMLRLEESAEQIPAELGITSVSTRIQFGEMRTTEDLLVPQSAEVQLTHSSGEIRRDTIQFTHCRVYTADSSIKFEAPSPEQGQARRRIAIGGFAVGSYDSHGA